MKIVTRSVIFVLIEADAPKPSINKKITSQMSIYLSLILVNYLIFGVRLVTGILELFESTNVNYHSAFGTVRDLQSGDNVLPLPYDNDCQKILSEFSKNKLFVKRLEHILILDFCIEKSKKSCPSNYFSIFEKEMILSTVTTEILDVHKNTLNIIFDKNRSGQQCIVRLNKIIKDEHLRLVKARNRCDAETLSDYIYLIYCAEHYRSNNPTGNYISAVTPILKRTIIKCLGSGDNS